MGKKMNIMFAALFFAAACITGWSGVKGTVYAAEIAKIEEDTKGSGEYYTYTTSAGKWEYSINKDGTVYIDTLYGKNSDEVEIPSEIDGRVVTGFSRVWYPEDLEIRTIIIPETITDIEQNVVSSTASYTLEEIIVKEGNQTYMSKDGILYDKRGKTLIWCPPNRKELKVPEGVETIGRYACSYGDFTELELPDSLKAIETYAFNGCYYITDLTIPGNVETIGTSTFGVCERLKSVCIQEGVKTIGRGMFWSCEKLSDVQLPESLTTIEEHAFLYCKKLKDISLPDGLTSIGKEAFRGCVGMVNIVIPNNVTIIKNYAFGNCYNLGSIRIPDSVQQIATKAFYKSDKVVIECSDNSYAKKYAQKRGIPYRIVSSTSGSKLGLLCNGQSVKNAQTLKVRVKKSYTLQAVRGTGKAAVKWKSSNAKVAAVKNGKVTVKKAGKATITATAPDGKKVSIKMNASKAAVKVTKIQATGSNTMKKGSSQVLNLTVTPASADNTKVSWKSSNTKIVTVDKNGKVTAKKKGTAVITATAKDGSKKKGSINITVK